MDGGKQMFHGILIGLGIGLPGGAILYYLYARKAIAAGKEYLGQLQAAVKKL